MNLVFPALIILAFVLPGVIFRLAYNKGDGAWNYPLGRLGPVSDQLPFALFFAACLDGAWSGIVHLIQRHAFTWLPAISYRACIAWLSNNFGKDQVEYERALTALTSAPHLIFAYFVGLYVFSFGTGRIFHKIVRGFRLDRRRRAFRFDNEWHYLLRGEILDFPEKIYRSGFGQSRPRVTTDQYRATILAAVVETKGSSYLYLGTLVDYFFDAKGDLDRLLLTGVRRRPLDDDEDEKSAHAYLDGTRYYEIRGHFFVLRMSEVRTLNIDYFTDEDEQALKSEIEQRIADAEADGGWVSDRGVSG